ncbi:MAG: MobQ family relaxase [Verrucomicrobiota bacterium]
MALFRLEAKIFSRAKCGRSVIAAAAYRAGTKLRDELREKTFDYARRARGVIQSEIFAPENAPAWAHDSSQLWNTVERSEKRVDAQLAREFVLAVPPELSPDDQFQTAVGWAKKELVTSGMVAEISLHHPASGTNPHVHILCTMRKLDGENFSAKKPREWNEKSWLFKQRETWAEAVNEALAQAGRPERVDHRTLKAQGIDREPQPKIGVAATAMQRKGVETERGKVVRQTKIWNEALPFFKSIRQDGEVQQVQQRGVGSRWWQHPVTFMAQVRERAMHAAQDVWNKLLAGRSRHHEKDEPGMER